MGDFICVFASLFLQILGAVYFILSLFSVCGEKREIRVTGTEQLRCEILPLIASGGEPLALIVTKQLMSDSEFKKELYMMLTRFPKLSARIIH